MEKDKIIYQTKTKIFNPTGILIMGLIGFFFIFMSDSWQIQLFMGGIFLVAIVGGTIRNYYTNGLRITEKQMELTKKNLNSRNESQILEFGQIKNVKYNVGGYRQDSAIYLEVEGKEKIKIPIAENSFEFGPVLKFLNDKGIKINLVHSDQELRMFIDGKITEFPMTNEKTA
ncbi:hypothetical protein [Maribacter sp. 1_MG-2023]|uniref:hypothetical protein n=1 Tax=Maribacter sp. 1_MG-2023 TaxID=3062677 RepID=UPI0026E38F95|nr:hypothetical protein [Maribacter sp. 1_MG-2023]MDO6470113.1 hypothetical protein [Maribacter sp. 1_MG-2023]